MLQNDFIVECVCVCFLSAIDHLNCIINEGQGVISLNLTFVSLQLCRKQFVALHSQPLLETLSSDFLNYIKKYQRSAVFVET